MMKVKMIRRCLTATAITLLIAGCQSAATLSMAVRTGDTVLVGLSGDAGKSISNTTASVLRPADINARLIDSNGNNRAVKVRSVFKVYGDPTANPLAANQAQWLALIDFVDGADNPVAVATGPATLNLTSSKFIDPMNVSTTILAGTGTPHPLRGAENNAEKLGFLAPARQARVSISGSAGSRLVGAVQYRFVVSREATNTALGLLSAIDGVKLPGRQDISFQTWTQPNPGGGTVLNVIMTTPQGVANSDLAAFDMALVAGLLGLDPNPAGYFDGSLESAVFYDVNGATIPNLQAQVSQVE